MDHSQRMNSELSFSPLVGKTSEENKSNFDKEVLNSNRNKNQEFNEQPKGRHTYYNIFYFLVIMLFKYMIDYKE